MTKFRRRRLSGVYFQRRQYTELEMTLAYLTGLILSACAFFALLPFLSRVH